MIRSLVGKQLSVLVLTLGVTVGCASSPKEASSSGASGDASQAIETAKKEVAEAKELGWVWRDTEDLLTQAEAAAAEGDSDTAVKLANKAGAQAKLAVNQYYLEKAKFLHQQASASKSLSADQKRALSEAQEAIRNAEGRKAYDLVAPIAGKDSA